LNPKPKGGQYHRNIQSYRLKDSIYQIGFIILDEGGKHFSMTNKELRISDTMVRIGNFRIIQTNKE
jgi:hypothetical protein